jgi:predicted phosphodiesterase
MAMTRRILTPDRRLILPKPRGLLGADGRPVEFASRRSFLGHLAGLGATMAGIPLVGCGSDADGTRAAADSGTGDAGIDVASDSALDNGPLADAADLGSDLAQADTAAPRKFRFAIVADTHVIDEWYEGPENSPLDTESMQFTNVRYTSARDRIRGLQTPVDFVVHVGDLIHDYPFDSIDYMWENRTRLDIAAEISLGFGVPFHMVLGNHDYDFRNAPRERTREIFADKLGIQPWSSFDHQGWKFVMLDCYYGPTFDINASTYTGDNGTFGEEQLQWLEAELEQGKPTFIFLHMMMTLIQETEIADLGLHSLLRRYRDQIQYVVAGHTHRWLLFGNEFGPKHMVMGATRYDEDCFIVCEVDPAAGTYTFLNEATWQEASVYAERWEEDA